MKKITSLVMLLFTVLSFSQDINGKIQTYLNENKEKLNLSNLDINDWIVESTGNSESTGIDNYFIKQRYQGIEIFRAVTNVWVKNNEVIDAKSRFVANLAIKVNTSTPSLSAIDAAGKAFTHFNITSKYPFQVLETISANKYKINNGDLTEDPIVAQLVFQQMKTGSLRLAWDLTFYTSDYNHLWSIRIDATNGTILEQNDQTVSCSFKKDVVHANAMSNKFVSSFYKPAVSPLQVQSGTYTVIPFSYISPDHSPFVAIANPDNATASPYGWHDTNGATGAEYTVTRGNNVWARTDYTGVNPTTASTVSTANGYSPDGGASLTFNFPYAGKSVSAQTSISAACTNLFYMNNIVHDVWYQYGFNEANGNYQQNNYGKGGTAADFVYADAQDGSTAATPTLDNSNFSAPVDGQKGRMQMYLWDIQKVTNPLFVVAPTAVAGNYNSRQNGFSPGHVDLPIAPAAIQSNLVIFNDGTADPGAPDNSDACTAAVNAAAISGHVVLIRRSLAAADGGNPCNFTVKIKNAQLAGATAVIVSNNIDVLDANNNPIDVPIGMSGADATITIPAIGVSKIVGDMLYAQLAAGVTTVKLQLPADYQPFVNSDGDFDNSIIAHEFGHGISIRLTGGRNNSSCLNNTDQAGEGWSDWFALMLQLKPGDVGTTPLGMATFVVNEPTTGAGIRDYPYTTDMAVNPMTYSYTNNYQYTDTSGNIVTEIHGTGSVWTTVLWDLAWAYIAKYGYDNNKYTGTGGNNKVMRLVLDACKLQPCSPSFIDSRDAIIAADQATTGGKDYCMIWQVFANRGFGINASAGDTNVGNDQVQDFTQPTIGTTPATGSNCTLSVDYFDNQNKDLFRVYPNPTNGDLNVRINSYVGKVNIQVIDINGRIVNEYRNEDFNVEKSLNLNSLQTGVYILKVTGDSLNFTQKIMKN